jgi:hypothetical protein
LEAIVLKRNHGRQSVLLCDPIAASRSTVTHRARDVEPLLPALHQLARYCQRNPGSPLSAHFPSVEVISSGAEGDPHMRLLRRVSGHAGRRALGLRFRHFVADRDRASYWQSRTASISKKIERCLRAHFGLSYHVGENLERWLRAFLSTKTKHGKRCNHAEQKNHKKCAQHTR